MSDSNRRVILRVKLLSRVLQRDDDHAIFKRGKKGRRKEVGMGFSLFGGEFLSPAATAYLEAVTKSRSWRCDNFGKQSGLSSGKND